MNFVEPIQIFFGPRKTFLGPRKIQQKYLPYILVFVQEIWSWWYSLLVQLIMFESMEIATKIQILIYKLNLKKFLPCRLVVNSNLCVIRAYVVDQKQPMGQRLLFADSDRLVSFFNIQHLSAYFSVHYKLFKFFFTYFYIDASCIFTNN